MSLILTGKDELDVSGQEGYLTVTGLKEGCI